MISKYFDEEIISYDEIKGHFNKNYKVTTSNGVFHLKILKDGKHEIRKWIDGSVVRKWDEETIKLVVFAIKKIHNRNETHSVMDYNLPNIKDDKYIKLINKYKDLELVPCHNDINKDNVLITKNKAILIDFEFMRQNNRYWDIANIIYEDSLGKEEIDLFLKYYPELKKEILLDFLYINKIFNDNWKLKFL